MQDKLALMSSRGDLRPLHAVLQFSNPPHRVSIDSNDSDDIGSDALLNLHPAHVNASIPYLNGFGFRVGGALISPPALSSSSHLSQKKKKDVLKPYRQGAGCGCPANGPHNHPVSDRQQSQHDSDYDSEEEEMAAHHRALASIRDASNEDPIARKYRMIAARKKAGPREMQEWRAEFAREQKDLDKKGMNRSHIIPNGCMSFFINTLF
jgi:hypothetical protein